MSVRKARQAGREEGGRGQALVEFALIIPIIVFVFMGVIEVALAFNATVGVNRASQNGAHLAAIMGNQLGADCLILSEIEKDVYAPNDRAKIQEVIVERTNRSGNGTLAEQRYVRTGVNRDCPLPDGSVAQLPYASPNPATYPEEQRCTALRGPRNLSGTRDAACPNPPFTPERQTVDNIAVSIRYRHLWATPLNAVFNVFAGGDVGWTIVQRNIFRIEPEI
jgi:hypothetical protein